MSIFDSRQIVWRPPLLQGSLLGRTYGHTSVVQHVQASGDCRTAGVLVRGNGQVIWCPHQHSYDTVESCSNKWIDVNDRFFTGYCNMRDIYVWAEDRLL